jgi:CelD/BcsL family acetyltransferase involved in cellulose biosynthesis
LAASLTGVPDMYTVELVNEIVFRESRDAWNGLTSVMSYPTVFSSWEWIYGWWQQFAEGRELRVLFISRDARLVGILPLFRERRILARDGRIGRVLGYCGASELYPDPLDIIAAEADADQCVDACLDFLSSGYADWDVLHLRFLLRKSSLLKQLTRRGMRSVQVSTAPYIQTIKGYDEYLQTLSGNERSSIRRRRRKLIDAQGVQYSDLSDVDSQYILKRLFYLHEQRAVHKNMQSTFTTDRIRAFHAGLLHRLDSSHVWLRGLRRGDEIVAVFYGFVWGGRLSYYQLGFDPRQAEASLGSVLLQETIREAFDKQYLEYNFLQGDEAFKFRWTDTERRLFSVDLYNDSWCGQMSRVAVGTKHYIKQHIGNLARGAPIAVSHCG